MVVGTNMVVYLKIVDSPQSHNSRKTGRRKRRFAGCEQARSEHYSTTQTRTQSGVPLDGTRGGGGGWGGGGGGGGGGGVVSLGIPLIMNSNTG
jgi:hypothetical protein